MNSDKGSEWVRKAIDFLFLNSPFKTSMGTLAGLIIWGFVPKLATELLRADFPSYPLLLWIALGVFIMNAPSLFVSTKLPPDVEIVLTLIEEGKKAGILDSIEAKQKYRQLIQKYLDNVNLSQTVRNEIEEMKKQLPETNS